MDIGDSSLRDRAAETSGEPFDSITIEVKNKWRYTSSPPLHIHAMDRDFNISDEN
jgi:hypothetical protein